MNSNIIIYYISLQILFIYILSISGLKFSQYVTDSKSIKILNKSINDAPVLKSLSSGDGASFLYDKSISFIKSLYDVNFQEVCHLKQVIVKIKIHVIDNMNPDFMVIDHLSFFNLLLLTLSQHDCAKNVYSIIFVWFEYFFFCKKVND